jgi:hypothetical protein
MISLLVLGSSWRALILFAILFGLFLLYLHSGWFDVDPAQPLFPIRRDDRGREIQRKALITAIGTGAVLFLILTATPLAASAALIAIGVASLVYLVSQLLLLARA